MWGYAIMAAASLIGGMMQNKAQAEQTRKNMLMNAAQIGFSTQSQAAGAMGSREQEANQSLMDTYRSALLQ